MVTLDQMKGAVGSLLFLWSDIERSLHEATRSGLFPSKTAAVHPISRALTVWSEGVMQAGAGRPLQTELCLRLHASLREALVIRNLVCHGLAGYSAEGSQPSQQAHLLVALGSDERVLTWGELQAMFRWMSRSGWLIGDLTRAAMEKDSESSEGRLRGWEVFLQQLMSAPLATPNGAAE